MRMNVSFSSKDKSMTPTFSNTIPVGGRGGTQVTINGEVVDTLPIDEYVDEKVQDKVDKKDGYSLVSNLEIERLSRVDNYNDAVLVQKVTKNESDIKTKADASELEFLAKKVETLQDTKPEDAFIYDYEVTYTKRVPQNVAKYAEIKEIGGNTIVNNYFDINLFVDQFPYHSTAVNVQQGTIASGYSFGIETKNTLGEIFKNLKIGNKYILEYTYDQDSGGISFGNKNIWSGEAFILNEFMYSSGIYFDCYIEPENEGPGIPHVVTYSNFRLYEVGKDIVNTKVTGLDITGPNILSVPYPQATGGLKNGVEITFEDDGHIILNGTATKSTSLLLYDVTDNLVLPETGVYIHPCHEVSIYVKSSDTKYISPGIFIPKNTDEYYNKYFVYLAINSGQTFNNLRILPCITKGAYYTPPTTYLKPYTFQIPQEIQNLPKYGMSMGGLKNKISWDNDKVKYVRMVTDTICDQKNLWSRVVTNNGIRYDYVTSGLDYPMLYETQSLELLCNKYNQSRVVGYKQKIFVFPDDIQEDGTINPWLKKLAEWESNGAPFRVIYPISNPEIIDVSNYFTQDNLIEVRSDGDIVAMNEDNNPVPSTIVYQKKEI